VSEDGWKLFGERLEQARQVLMEAKERGVQDPCWYTNLLTVAMGQSWGREDYDPVFEKAVAAHPEFYELYAQRDLYLQPKWNGEPGESAKFQQSVGKEKGAEIYVRLIWFRQSGDLKKYLRAPDKDWKFIKQGWDAMMAKYPDSNYNLNAYAKWAVARGDRARAKELLDKIGDHYHPSVWKDVEKFGNAVGWANETK
jgi:hypothetical protein